MIRSELLSCEVCQTDYELLAYDEASRYACSICHQDVVVAGRRLSPIAEEPEPEPENHSRLQYLYGCRGFRSGAARRNDPGTTPALEWIDAHTTIFRTTAPAEDGEMPIENRPLDDQSKQMGRYQIITEIARGGMGVVYLAVDHETKSNVALKVMLSGPYASSANVDRFMREARAAGKLEHPSIVRIHDVGEVRGHTYFAMDFIKGLTLARAIHQTGPLPLSEVLRIGATVARAADHAHRANIIHRDIKPGNVILTVEGQPLVTDFGLALELTDDSHRLTRTGQVMGTPAYMPPEQALGNARDIGPATDTYAIGALLFEMATGKPPYGGENSTQTLLQVVAGPPPPLRKVTPSLPVGLEILVRRAMAPRPEHRFDSALDLAEELERMLRGDPIKTRAPSLRSRATNWTSAYKFEVAIAIVFLILIGALLFVTA